MKLGLLICLIIALALVGLWCAQEDTLALSVTEIDNGVIIENTGTVSCIAIVASPEGQQQFELAIGQSITVTDISHPIQVSAVAS
jgi:hypothetical protein